MAGLSPRVGSETGRSGAQERAAAGGRAGSPRAPQVGGARGGAASAADVMQLSATLIRESKFYTLHRAIEDAVRAAAAFHGVAAAGSNDAVTPELVDALLTTRGVDHAESIPQVVSLLPYACERLDMVDVAFPWYAWLYSSATMRRALPDAAVEAVFKRYAAFLVGVMDDAAHAQAAVASAPGDVDVATLPSRRARALDVCAAAVEAGARGVEAIAARARALEDVPVEAALRQATAEAIVGPLSPRLAAHAASVDLGREELEDAVAADPSNALLWWRLALVLEEARDHIGALTALDECGFAIRVLSRSAMAEDAVRMAAFRRLCPLFLPPLLAARICATHLGRSEDALRHAAAARAVAEEEVEEARAEEAAAASSPAADPGQLFDEDLRLSRTACATLGCVAACVALASVEVVRAREQATHAERVALALRAQAALADAEALLGTEGSPPPPPQRSRPHRRGSDAAPSPDASADAATPPRRSELERRMRRHLRSAVHFVQAQCAAERGQLTEALQLVCELSAILPAQFEPRAATLHALLLSAQREPGEALRVCRAALRHNCDDVGLLWAEAALVSRTEGPATGLRLYKEALAQAREQLATQAEDDSPTLSCVVTEARDGPRDRMLRHDPAQAARSVEGAEGAGDSVETPLGAVPPSLPLRTWFSVMPPLGARTTQREARALLVRVACSTVRSMLTVERGARGGEALELLEVLRAEAEVAADPALRADIEHHNALCLAAQDRGQAAYSALHTALAFDAWHVPTLVALGKHHYALALTPLHEDPGQGVARAILLSRASGDGDEVGADPALRPKVARERELDKAQSYLALAARADNDNYEAWHKLGLVRNAQGDVERASSALFSALEKEDTAPLLPFSAVPARV